tara:strand:- start:21 stop:278 length:258 start_codon:yes stop_codon:yes gene_type:complete
MGQIADSLREIIQTMKDGDEVFRQDLKRIEEAAEKLVETSNRLTESTNNLISELDPVWEEEDETSDEPSDDEMKAAFGTKWHDGL